METTALINAFLTHQQAVGRSARTISRRRWSLGLWADHLQGGEPTVEALEAFIVRWPAAQSRYSIRSDIHQLYRFAHNRGLCSCPDPTDGLEPPRLPRRDATPIPAAQVRRLLEILDGDDRLVILLAACAGMRCTEIAELDSADVDLAGRWIYVTGKGGHRRRVPLADVLAEVLVHRCGPVVPYSTGGSVGNRIRTLFRRYGISGRPHDLRHSFATECDDLLGGDVVVLAQMMRHADIATTMRYVKPRRTGHDIVDRLYAA